MKQILLMISVVALVGCGESEKILSEDEGIYGTNNSKFNIFAKDHNATRYKRDDFRAYTYRAQHKRIAFVTYFIDDIYIDESGTHRMILRLSGSTKDLDLTIPAAMQEEVLKVVGETKNFKRWYVAATLGPAESQFHISGSTEVPSLDTYHKMVIKGDLVGIEEDEMK
jgi:hypothetical protein